MNKTNLKELNTMRINQNTGTPSDMLNAIKNAMAFAARASIPMPEEIEKHVVDFINQSLTVLMISDDPNEVKAAEKLQKLIFKKKEVKDVA